MKNRSCAFNPIVLLLVFWLAQSAVAYEDPEKLNRKISPPSGASRRRINVVEKLILSTFLGIATGLTAAFLFAFLIRCFIAHMKRVPILTGAVVFSPKLSPKALSSALADASELLGSSPSGKYYRINIDDTHSAAVKVLVPYLRGDSFTRRVQQELQTLAAFTHPNLMRLHAYVRDSGTLSLFYDYVHNGSLEDAMDNVRRSEFELSWEIRLRVAIGIAKGLEHLHFGFAESILHCNLKPRNVLLDEEFEPKLGDIGVGRILPFTNEGSVYSAPEWFENSRCTDKSDVFSFGMILVLLLTGRDAEESFFGEMVDGVSIGGWLRHLQEDGEIQGVLDKSILIDGEEDEMLMAMKIAVVCLSEVPEDRPSSDELVSMLSQLRNF